MKTLPTVLIYFHEVARNGSIKDAAEALHVSASAISRQISNLERSLGVAVFDRHPRGMTLTDAGRLLLAHIRRSEAEGDALFREMRDAQSHRTRVIKVATVHGFSSTLVPRAMAKFSVAYPDVAFEMLVLPTAEATRQVIEGQVDVAVAFELGPQGDVSVDFSSHAPVFAVVTLNHPLASRESVGLRDICKYKLVLSSPGTSQRTLFDIAIQREGLTADIVLEADHVAPALEFIRNSAGVTFLNQLVLPPGSDDLALVPLDNPVFGQRQVQIQTMTGRRRPPRLAAFIEALAEEILR